MLSYVSTILNWISRHAFGRQANASSVLLAIAAAAGAMIVSAWMLIAAGIALDGWQWLLVGIIAFDIGGGIAANATAAAARQYHDPQRPWAPLLFAAGHMHPFVIAWLLPGYGWFAASVLYGVVVAAVAATSLAPPGLRRSASLFLSAVGIAVCAVVPGGDGWAWLAPMLVLKLVAAHATLGSSE